jgi:3-oxoacyl-[acyl-carrier-protein] synthase-3
MTIDKIDYILPHQPSKRILVDVAQRINAPIEKVLMNMDRYANTVAGTIPILLAENWDKFEKEQKIIFAAIGSGWTYGAAIYEV